MSDPVIASGDDRASLVGVFAAVGEMADRVAAHDWASTPLGAIDQWPQSLRTAVSILLNTRYPMFLFWGPDAICIYELRLSTRDDASADTPNPGTARTHVDGRGTVLLAEDNRDMRNHLSRILEPEWTVRLARDGLEALELARADRPDLVITDVMMPRLDGLGLVRALRDDELLCDVPVIMLSARAGQESALEGIDAGATDYLVKPFSPVDLASRVRHQHAAQSCSSPTPRRGRGLLQPHRRACTPRIATGRGRHQSRRGGRDVRPVTPALRRGRRWSCGRAARRGADRRHSPARRSARRHSSAVRTSCSPSARTESVQSSATSWVTASRPRPRWRGCEP